MSCARTGNGNYCKLFLQEYVVQAQQSKTSLVATYICNTEHFSELKMAVAAISNFRYFSIFIIYDLQCHVIPLWGVFEGGESIFTINLRINIENVGHMAGLI